MVDIRPQDLNPAVTPIDADSPIIIDQGLAGVNRTTSTQMVNAVAPVASKSEAEIGTNDVKRMTALKTKQSIASEVGVSVASYASGQAGLSAVQSVNGKSGNAVTLVKGDVGLSNVDNTSDANKPVSTAQQTALNLKADKSIQIIASGGLTGGGNIGGNVTVELDTITASSLAKADSAVQSVSGKSGNAITLVKGDVGLGNVDNTSDVNKPVSTAQQAALNLKANTATQVIAGAGLTGGGDLSDSRTISVGAGTGISVAADAVSLDAPTIASLAKADTAIQAPGGTAGQVLSKSSATEGDVSWADVEGATAVSYGPQTLTPEQQGQARSNIDAFKTPSGAVGQFLRGDGSAQSVIGTVTAAAGGSIVQRGNNANGEFVRFADGTQICTNTRSVGPIDIATGQIFRTNTVPWTFPASFVGDNIGYGGSVTGGAAWVTATSVASSQANTRLMSSITNASSDLTLKEFAIGRWK